MNNVCRWIVTLGFALVFIATSAHAAIVDGLIAHWTLDGSANDVTGNMHDGTVFGAIPTVDRLMNPDSAYAFDGNDYISIPDSSDFTLGNNPFTITAWSKIDAFSTDGGYYLIGHDVGPGTTNKWILFQGNGGISFITTTTGWVSLGSYDFHVSDWHHIAVQREGDFLTAFVDGNPIGNAAFTATIPDPAAALLIGDAETQHDGRNYRGSIDDVRIYSRALSLEEIQNLAAVPLPPALCLLGSGIIGLIGIVKRKKFSLYRTVRH
jgi:hypothetical protein